MVIFRVCIERGISLSNGYFLLSLLLSCAGALRVLGGLDRCGDIAGSLGILGGGLMRTVHTSLPSEAQAHPGPYWAVSLGVLGVLDDRVLGGLARGFGLGGLLSLPASDWLTVGNG